MFCKIDTSLAHREGGAYLFFLTPSHFEMKNYEKCAEQCLKFNRI